MLGWIFSFVVIVTTIVTGETSTWTTSLGDDNPSEVEEHSDRQARFFPLFSVVRFANSECIGSNSFNGTCFTKRECSKYGGNPSGSCATNLGVCCTFRKTCGATTNINNTYFVNEGYYSAHTGAERCMITVYPCTTNICQLRIDFLDFNLAQPNASGICDLDFLLVTGSARRVPRICGENVGQHMYVDFNGNNPITISVITNAAYRFARKWNLRVQQIACDSPWRAPSGCLQYYKTISGTVMSFNYGTIPNPRVPTTTSIGTRQMQNLNYKICVRPALGDCTIEWSQPDPTSFTVSGDSGLITGAADEDLSESGTECTHNYVIVPNPSNTTGGRYDADRFCGNGFQRKTSACFILYVVTNPAPGEVVDVENRGFTLNYRQLACEV
ncbi:uncharacterized protein LOC107040478 [Diachasma alloeum]|uniref:uncharacterized protein LOC107040478 n=1 Tax=Diachasma alloeum TaxID=454923 RepID=UPI0007384E9C|nr:uncharacterized protein LOC107040478 [Diachasma alloeum]